MSARLRAEDGFTLIETLVACVIGVIILGAAGGLLSVAATSQRQTSDRMEGIQNGRQLMDTITGRLRSQVCIGPSDSSQPGKFAALQSAAGDTVTFYSSLAPAPTTSGVLQIDKRTLRFVPIAGSPVDGAIVEDVYRGTQPDASTTPTFPATPTTTRTLAGRVSRSAAGAPIFRYHRYHSDTSPAVVELAPPLDAASRELVVRIDVAFDSHPAAGGDPDLRTVYSDQTFVRTADPLDPKHSPKCI